MNTKQFYQSIQKDRREDNSYSVSKIKYILETIGTNKKVLDIGCNEGYIGEKIIRQGNAVYGVDIIRKNLLAAKKRGLKTTFCDISTQKLPYTSGTFDTVLLADVIEHIFDTDRLLAECYRVLKKNGEIVVTTPNVASLGRRLMLLCGVSPFLEYSVLLPTNYFPSMGHIRYYTCDTLKKQFLFHNFRCITILGDVINFGFFYIPLFSKYFSSFAVELMGSARK